MAANCAADTHTEVIEVENDHQSAGGGVGGGYGGEVLNCITHVQRSVTATAHQFRKSCWCYSVRKYHHIMCKYQSIDVRKGHRPEGLWNCLSRAT